MDIEYADVYADESAMFVFAASLPEQRFFPVRLPGQLIGSRVPSGDGAAGDRRR
jgi:hypothetical protein